MDRNKRTLAISRISTGLIKARLGDSPVYLGLPTKLHVYVGNEIYEEAFNSAVAEGLLTDEQVQGILAQQGLWSYQLEQEIESTRQSLDDLKVSTYESRFRLQDFQLNKLRIKKKKKELEDLLTRRHTFDYVSAEGLASLYRLNYLIISGLKDSNFIDLKLSLNDIMAEELNQLKLAYLSARVDEPTIRLLARTEPWRSYWSVSDKNNVFDRPLLEWTEDQQALVIWSRLYDSLREHTEPPTEDVVNDDDAFDGWLILQSRKNKTEIAKKGAEISISKNKKIRDAQEVFIMVGNEKNPMTGENIQIAQDLDDVKRLDAVLNDDRARAVKKERFATVAAMGEVKIQHFGDIQRDLKQQVHEAYRQRMKGK